LGGRVLNNKKIKSFVRCECSTGSTGCYLLYLCLQNLWSCGHL